MGLEPTITRSTIWCISRFATVPKMEPRDGFAPSISRLQGECIAIYAYGAMVGSEGFEPPIGTV
jgi:hypothetical protein